MQSSSLLSFSPSFNSYYSGKLAEIAARVVEEFRAEESESKEIEESDGYGDRGEEETEVEEKDVKNNEEEEDDDDDEFEFSFVSTEVDSSTISADEIFYNGQIRPVYPVFNRDLLLGEIDVESLNSSKDPSPVSVRIPLRKLFTDERDTLSCSSSEADELDGIQPGTYCVWMPKAAPEKSPGNCKKSNSTGSSKRWKLRNLLYRSNSDGKDTFVFLTPSKRDAKVEKITNEPSKVTGNVKAKVVTGGGEGVLMRATNEAQCAKNKGMKEGDRRRSYLPYRQDLVGLFGNMNGMSKNMHPF